MKEELKTSVVIAAHNEEDAIDRCLQSVLSNDPDEVILVDDNSTDDTVERAEEYPVKVLKNEENSEKVR